MSDQPTKIFLSLDLATAEVYYRDDKAEYYLVKVNFPDIELFINSISVRRSPRYGDLWVQMPAFKRGNGYIKPIELTKESVLRKKIESLVLEAVEALKTPDILPTDEDIENLDELMDKAFEELEKDSNKPP